MTGEKKSENKKKIIKENKSGPKRLFGYVRESDGMVIHSTQEMKMIVHDSSYFYRREESDIATIG